MKPKRRRDNRYLENERSLFSFQGVRVFILLVGLLFVLVYAGAYLLSEKTLPIRNVHISGDFRYLNQDHMKKMITPLLRGNFFTVDIKSIQKIISAEPWVQTVSISRIWPETLRVNIVEEQAIARWHGGGVLTTQGNRIEVRAGFDARVLPLFSGPDIYRKEMVATYLEVQPLLARIGLRINLLSVSARRAWSLTLNNGVDIRIGRDQVVPRIERLTRIYASVLETKITDIRVIDMRYINGFAIKWKSNNKAQKFAFGGRN